MAIQVHRFFTKYEQLYENYEYMNPKTGEPETRARIVKGKYKEVDWVEYGQVGNDRLKIIDKVSNLAAVMDINLAGRNPTVPLAHARWAEIRPMYENWKAGRAISPEGTPLAVFPGLSTEQVDQLTMRGVRTVETLAQLNDLHFERLGIPGLRDVVTQAQMFLKAQDKAAVVDELAQKDLQIADLNDKVEVLMQMMAEMRAGTLPQTGTVVIEKPLADADFEQEDFVDPRAEDIGPIDDLPQPTDLVLDEPAGDVEIRPSSNKRGKRAA